MEDIEHIVSYTHKNAPKVICTLFTGHPVRRVFSCVTVMSIS